MLEAQASGLPAIVTDRGGPQEIVVTGKSGIIIDLDKPNALLEAMRRFNGKNGLTESMRYAACANADGSGWGGVFDCFWNGTPQHESETMAV